VENSLRQEEGPGYKPRADLLREVSKTREELGEERKKNRRLDLVVEKLEKELRRYRVKPFLDEDFAGVRVFQKELVEGLREEGILRNEQILYRLGVDPTEQEAIKGISRQLEILAEYGLVQYTLKGWRWIR